MSAAEKAGECIWGEDEVKKVKAELLPPEINDGSNGIVNCANMFWAMIDKSLNYCIKQPKVVGFVVLSSCFVYFVFIPIVADFLEDQKIKNEERRARKWGQSLTRAIREDRMVQSVTDRLGAADAATISSLIGDLQDNTPGTRNVEDAFSLLSREDDSKQREIILKALRCLKDRREK